jgi:hypothetical protein
MIQFKKKSKSWSHLQENLRKVTENGSSALNKWLTGK